MDAQLVIFKSNGQRRDFPLVGSVVVMGRGSDCDLRIPIPSASRRHCELMLSARQLKVKDLSSANGTYVNNKRVDEAELSPGDRLTIGTVVFTVQIDGKPQEIAPTKASPQPAAEVEAKGAEEVVELEADIAVPTEGAFDALTVVADGAGEDTDESDPIAALEALAAESEEEEKNA